VAKASKNKELVEVEAMAKKLLKLMGSGAEVVVEEDKENAAYVVDIKTEEEKGLLIGRHGETLISLQTILGLMVKNELGEWKRLVVNIGDWRERQEEQLRKLAQEVAERAKQTQEPQPLYNLNASQRRIIHLELAQDPEVETESTGEGVERYLVVKPKNK
jgi:spoIIIJ-associated protein